MEETVDLSRRYGLEMLWIVDDNFLVDLDRARAICGGLVRAGAQFKWSIQATTNLTARLSLEDLKLLHERAAPDMPGRRIGLAKSLEGMNKDFQDFPPSMKAAARCLEAGIRPSFNIIFAFPGEGAKERRETISFVMDVCRRFPALNSGPISSLRIRALPSWSKIAELGVQTPDSLEGWVDFFPALHQASLAERPRSRGTAGNARLSAALPSIAFRSRRTRASPLPGWRRNASRCPRAGVLTTALTAFRSSFG